MGLFEVRSNRHAQIYGGRTFYTIKAVGKFVKVNAGGEKKTLKFTRRKDATEMLKRLNILHIWTAIGADEMKGIDYFY